VGSRRNVATLGPITGGAFIDFGVGHCGVSGLGWHLGCRKAGMGTGALVFEDICWRRRAI